MIITLSPAFMEGRAFPEDHIREVARQVGVHYRVKWANERSARGVLTKAAGSYVNASDAEHDSFIGGIFRLDPEAYVRTSMAIYNTVAEFNARLPLERAKPIHKPAPAKA